MRTFFSYVVRIAQAGYSNKAIGRGTGVVLVSLAAGVGISLGARFTSSDARVPSQPDTRGTGEERIARVGRDGVTVPEAVRTQMGLHSAPASSSVQPVRLPSLQGVLALESDSLSRARSRFPGEVVQIGQSSLSSAAPALRVGDAVKKGDLLAIVWSKELGEKKSELLDALSRLRLDQDRLSRYTSLGAGVVAAQQVREAAATVEASEIAVAKAEATLRAWRLNEGEIQSIIDAAGKLATPAGRREWAADRRWAQVEIRASLDGTILEKNVAVGDVVESNDDLFKIGDLSSLALWAHVYEEDLPRLQALSWPLSCTVTLPSQPGKVFRATLTRLGALIDPTQHTALATGRLENSAGVLRAGQFVSVNLELPPVSGELALPPAAVVEDGRESVVFVQADVAGAGFIKRSVEVVRRVHDAIFVRASESGIRPGEQVVTDGSLLLRQAMDQLPATARN